MKRLPSTLPKNLSKNSPSKTIQLGRDETAEQELQTKLQPGVEKDILGEEQGSDVELLLKFNPHEYIKLLGSTLNVPGVYQMALDTIMSHVKQIHETLIIILKEFNKRNQEFKITKLHLKEKNQHMMRLMRQWEHDKDRLRNLRLKERQLLYNYFFSWKEEALQQEWNLIRYLQTVENDWYERKDCSIRNEGAFWKGLKQSNLESSMDVEDLHNTATSLEEDMNQLHNECISLMKEGLILENSHIVQYLKNVQKEWFICEFDSHDKQIINLVSETKSALELDDSFRNAKDVILGEQEIDILICEEMALSKIAKDEKMQEEANSPPAHVQIELSSQLPNINSIVSAEHVTIPENLVTPTSPNLIQESRSAFQLPSFKPNKNNLVPQDYNISNSPMDLDIEINNPDEDSVSIIADTQIQVPINETEEITFSQPTELDSNLITKPIKDINFDKKTIHPENLNPDLIINDDRIENTISIEENVKISLPERSQSPIHVHIETKKRSKSIRRSNWNSTKEIHRVRKKKAIETRKRASIQNLDTYLNVDDVVIPLPVRDVQHNDTQRSLGPVKDFEEKLKESQKNSPSKETDSDVEQVSHSPLTPTKTTSPTIKTPPNTNPQSSMEATELLTPNESLETQKIIPSIQSYSFSKEEASEEVEQEETATHDADVKSDASVSSSDRIFSPLTPIVDTEYINNFTPNTFKPHPPSSPQSIEKPRNSRRSSTSSIIRKMNQSTAPNIRSASRSQILSPKNRSSSVSDSTTPILKNNTKVITVVQSNPNMNKRLLTEIDTLRSSLSEKDSEIAHLRRLLKDAENDRNSIMESEYRRVLHEERRLLSSRKIGKVVYPTVNIPLLPVDDVSNLQFQATDLGTARERISNDPVSPLPKLLFHDEKHANLKASTPINRNFMRVTDSWTSMDCEQTTVQHQSITSDKLKRRYSASTSRRTPHSARLSSSLTDLKKDTGLYSLSPKKLRHGKSARRSSKGRNSLISQ